MSNEAAILSHQPSAISHNYSHKKQILFVTHDSNLQGGASITLFNTMLDLKARYDVEPVLLAASEGEFPAKCREHNIDVIIEKFEWRVRLNNTKMILRRRIRYMRKYCIRRMSYKRKIFTRLNDYHFDLVYTNTSVIEIGYYIARHFHIPHIWHITELAEENGYVYVIPESRIRKKYCNSDAVITVSRSMYETLVNETKLCSEKNTRLIYNGIKISAPYMKSYNTDGQINFCMVSNIIPVKNQLMALKACMKLKSMTDRFMLHIIGLDDSKYAQELKQFVISHELEGHVKLWGFRYDVNEMLRTMDVGLTLSTHEAFGRVTVEYMLNYMPVIGTDTGATPEIVIDGDTGYICPLNDSDRLAELMNRFIIRPELFEMGNRGRERAVQYFSIEHNTDEIYKLFN